MKKIHLVFRGVIISASIILLSACTQLHKKITLGKLSSGAMVSLINEPGGYWGINISGDSLTEFTQSKPVFVEVFRDKENKIQITSGYKKVNKKAGMIIANATLSDSLGAEFDVEDQWKINSSVLSLSRKVTVKGTLDSTGFYSSISIISDTLQKWENTKYLAPGILYGEPHTNPTALGGSAYYGARHFSIREDYMAAPLFGLAFKNGSWAALLNPSPNGATTQTETTASANIPVTDDQLQFGSVNVHDSPVGIEIGFSLPGTTYEFPGRFFGGISGNSEPLKQTERRRYHPVKDGFIQNYKVDFSFGRQKSFPDMERQIWRWAWETLDPQVAPVDIEVVRRTLIDHLADRVLVYNNRAGIPFVIDAVTGKPGSFRPALMARRFSMQPAAGNQGSPMGRRAPVSSNEELIKWARSIGIDIDPNAAELDLWPKIVIGFCGKHFEVAQQLLLESDRDSTERGKRMRKLGEMIISSLIHIVPVAPPCGEGFDIRTGQPGAIHGGTGFSVRSWAEDMSMMIDLIRQEKESRHERPEWFRYAKDYTDWLLTQQREDGSFPMTWLDKTGAVKEGTPGVTSYAAVPLLVKMCEETGDKKYLESAVRAADYVWENFGSKCVYLGATGTATVADKESGMLSLEAFITLFENTKDSKWLDRAKAAGDYTESWIWIWNVPMPIGAKYEELGWKPGVPTIGVNGIGSNDIGGVDQYLDWAVPSYAKLYKYTGDKHYLDVAYVLLHGTKAMLALPGRVYDLKGPGWQQEHWRMGPVRGIGAHRTWLPWISINHLHGITALEKFDPELYKQLSKGM
jgi:hypothetical protein